MHGRAEEGLPQAAPFWREIARRALFILESYGFKDFAAVDKACRQNSACVVGVPIERELLIKQLKTIALANIEDKIDIPLENLR